MTSGSFRSRTPAEVSLRGRSASAAGLAYAIGAYALWGVLPGYFLLLAPTSPVEVVAWRIVLSVAFCVLLVAVVRGWGRLRAILRDRGTLGWLVLAGCLVTVNWSVFVFAVSTGHVVEASLGYFINPIVTVLFGVLQRERLRPLQWAAVAVSAVAVVVLVIAYGEFPWIAILLALSFGVYGLVKHRVGARVDAITGLAVETGAVAPIAAGVLVWIGVSGGLGGLSMGQHGVWHTVLLLPAGAITAVPLLLFAAGARRLPLSTVGFTQYLAPVLQFLTGVLLLHEEMPPARWIGFAIVWVALAMLIADTLRNRLRSGTR
ncbi:MAG: EamA family transporter RarD [Microbacteriaceae bacterium]|nr:EamA family transporter RarD [Microbacteriaceae bacterium]